MVDVRDVFEDSPRRRLRLGAMVLLAVVADFALNTLLDPQGWRTQPGRLVVSFVAGSLVLFLLGVYLGRRAWPRRGLKLSRHLLKRRLRRRNAGIVVLTDRPDQTFSIGKRLLEVVGFSAGATIILTVALSLLGIRLNLTFASASLVLVFALWGCFILVPYWIFSHMGLRQIDPVRWLVQPVGKRYGERLKLSNGVLLLIAMGAVVQLAFRAGASGDAALVEGVTVVGHVVASVLVSAATALAFYVHDEHALVRALEKEALSMGVKDGRSMSDGDFLPRVPAQPSEEKDLLARAKL